MGQKMDKTASILGTVVTIAGAAATILTALSNKK